MSENQEKIQRSILERTERTAQTQVSAKDELKRQGESLKNSNKNINELRDERTAADRDLSHIKKNQNVFKRFLMNCCFCCCCQCCKDCCEDKTTEPFIAPVTTESEEPDPDDDTVNKNWTQRYEPKTWYQKMDQNLKKLQEDAQDMETQLKKQNKSAAKLNEKIKSENKALEKSTQTMKEIIK